MQTDLFSQAHNKPIGNDYRQENSREADASIDKEAMHKLILKAITQLKIRVTFREIASYLKLKDEQIWKRLSEMEKKGLIVVAGKKLDPITKRLCSTWMLKPTE